MLVEVRWHGRGGQGAVTSAEILAHAAINEGQYAQASPSFGPERRGSPVLAFNRISDSSISIRSEIYKPDIVVVIDPKLLKTVDVTSGLKEGGLVILNLAKPLSEVKASFALKGRLAAVDAKKIASELGIPAFNTSMLGAFIRAAGLVKMDSVLEAVMERFGGKVGPKNCQAVERGFKETVLEG